MSDIQKFKNIIPIGKQEYAYQCEGIKQVFQIEGFPPHRSSGKEPYNNAEKDQVFRYEFEIERFTGNSLTVSLRKIFHSKPNQEVKTILYQRSMSFSEFVNQVFAGVEVNAYENQ